MFNIYNKNEKILFLLCLIECISVIGAFLLIPRIDFFSLNNVSRANAFPADSAEGATVLSLIVALTAMLVIITVLYSVGLYAWRHISSPYLIATRLMVGFLVSAPLLFAGYYLVARGSNYAPMFAGAVGVSFCVIVAVRVLFHGLLKQDLLKRRVVVLGAGSQAASIADLEQKRDAGFLCVGFSPIEGETVRVPSIRQLSEDAFSQCVQESRLIDEIVIATEDRRNNLPLEDLVHYRLEGVMVTDFQSFCEREMGRVDLDRLTPSWFLFKRGFRNTATQRALKRTFDISAALLLIVLFIPVIAITALALLVSRDGPILYRQDRVGLGGKVFTLLKFRSMRADAEQNGAPQWARANDDRVTPLGSLLRKTRADELPQLLNILRGDMSLVGPRPERPHFVEELKGQLPYYDQRHRVKPGITGWAQVNFKYAGSLEDSKTKLEHDLYYIKYYSLYLDLIILLQTVRVVLWSEGAR